jgi:hypothetical protein
MEHESSTAIRAMLITYRKGMLSSNDTVALIQRMILRGEYRGRAEEQRTQRENATQKRDALSPTQTV